MTRFAFFLLLAVLASALYLVSVQYESRQLYSELDRARSQARNIETDNERLQVERRAQSAPLRVEKLAKEQLQMRTVTPSTPQAPCWPARRRSGAASSSLLLSRWVLLHWRREPPISRFMRTTSFKSRVKCVSPGRWNCQQIEAVFWIGTA